MILIKMYLFKEWQLLYTRKLDTHCQAMRQEVMPEKFQLYASQMHGAEIVTVYSFQLPVNCNEWQYSNYCIERLLKNMLLKP